MSENLFKKVEELYASGKITEEQKKELLKALGYDSERQQTISQIQVNLRSIGIEIVGVENIDFPKVEQGSLRIRKDESVLIIDEPIGVSTFAKLVVPYKSNLIIKSVSSNISVSSILGFLQIQSVSSDVLVKNVSDRLVISVISGDVELENIFGTLNVNTKSGDIKANGGKVNALIKTYSGDIDINNIEFKDSRLNTFNGDISLNSVKFFGKSFLNTYFGDVTLSLLNSVLVRATSTLGSVNNKSSSKVTESEGEVEIVTKFGDILVEEVDE